MNLSVTAVRRADRQDVPAVREIAAHFGRVPDDAHWPAGEVLVLGSPPIGFAHVLTTRDGHHLDALAVRPEAGRRGRGTTLLRAAYGLVVQAGGDVLTTAVQEPWVPWYERHGFTVDAARAADGDAGDRVALRRAVLDEPVPIPAVSVLPVREGRSGLEVFVQHRVGTMDFVPNAVVFPGGRVDPGDAEAGASLAVPDEVLAVHESAWAGTDIASLGGGEVAARTLLATAIREVQEETGARIDPAALLPWDDWITPIGGPKRFDVRFFLLPVTDADLGAAFRHATTEAHRSEWTPVTEVARGAEDGSLMLVAPTRVLIDELGRLPDLDAAVGLAPQIVPIGHDLCPDPARRGRLGPYASNRPAGPAG